jgi:hypothetical protein
MQDTNKEVTQFIKSMKLNLKEKFGVDVPHAALRASYLMALGENPHAFAGRAAPGEQKKAEIRARVLFEWVYPDEDGDSAQAMLDLNTGKLSDVLTPSDIFEYGDTVRTRIEVGSGEYLFEVHYRRTSASSGDWYVGEKDLPRVRQALFPESWRIPVGFYPAEWNLAAESEARWYRVTYKENYRDEGSFAYNCHALNEAAARREVEELFPHGEIIQISEVR